MSKKSKVLSLGDLCNRAEVLRQSGKTIALCHGTFDLLHIGHIKHLSSAKRKADVLFVTVTGDSYVNKGPGRPVFNETLRAEQLSALEDVDNVAVNHAESSVNVIHALKPDYYVKGPDYQVNEDDITGNIFEEVNAVESYGGSVVYTGDITFSSSNILNETSELFEGDTREFLKEFRTAYSADQALAEMETLKDLKVLVIGDAIIDEYHYTAPLGQTGKYNVLSVKYEQEEKFAGGAIAVANHIAGFVGHTSLLTGLGSVDSHEQFIREKLHRNVEAEFHYFSESPTLTKRRYVDGEFNKLFEVYFYDDSPVDAPFETEVCNWLDAHASEFDLVIVPDFGNGLITDRMIETLTSKARFLAVNTQVNSGNRGYHVITRYSKADVVSLNEIELRAATHDRQGSIEKLATNLASSLDAKFVAVTRGKQGVELFQNGMKGGIKIPALSTTVIDRIGAGDAFLSIFSIMAANDSDPKLSAFCGAAAAAIDVQIVCNREAIEPVPLYRFVTTLLK